IGVIKSVRNLGDGLEISISSAIVNSDAKIDDSISVNGVCLTVVKKDDKSFTVQAVKETILRTGIKSLTSGNKVNLEPALKPEDRLGGHIVQGHVDGIGEIIKIITNQNGKEYWIRTDKDTAHYIVTKGSVCLEGISLTVAESDTYNFRVAIIPHTENKTTAKDWTGGKKINIETDIIGRYIEKFLHTDKRGLTIEKLSELGY
ncbi:MAG: riboflavin synthase, partial [Candidatus Delongbacteria bacterium]|nr:riboflavin synthase [Candidatus Delongbacteria bacterium]